MSCEIPENNANNANNVSNANNANNANNVNIAVNNASNANIAVNNASNANIMNISGNNVNNRDDVFVNLTVISNIIPGDKLLVDDKLLNIDTSRFQFVTRWFKGANRVDTMQFIRDVLEKSFQLNDECISNKDSKTLLTLMATLKNVIKGLNHLKQTYPTDKLIQSEIDVMIENIITKLNNNSNLVQFI
jgi:hypothetical protein